MKIKEIQMPHTSRFARVISRFQESRMEKGASPSIASRLSAGFCIALLLLAALPAPQSLHAAGVNAALLRKFGYNGRYTGIVRGTFSTRVIHTSPFTISPISDLLSVAVPPPRKGIVKDPKGEGAYKILYTAAADRVRARIRGSYYGTAYNPDAGLMTVRSGIREMIIKRNPKNGRIIKLSFRDRLTERAEDNSNRIYVMWRLQGTLRR